MSGVVSKFLELTKSRTSLLNKTQFPLSRSNYKYVDPLVRDLIPKIGKPDEPRIVVAMSSGVDSSVCAGLFKLLGFNKIHGVYMQNWGGSASADGEEGKCWEKDWKDVEKLGKFLSIPVEKVDFQKEYWVDVFQPMVESYEMGETPNPDLGCNRYIKFGKLMEYLDNKYKNYVLVTGHYSRVFTREVEEEINETRETDQKKKNSAGGKHVFMDNYLADKCKHYDLFKSFDQSKDQSYYLSNINGNILNKIILPLGNFQKIEVRELAKLMDLPTAEKKDSQGICFVENSQSKGNFNKFLSNYTTEEEGDVVSFENTTGKKIVWGKHKGLWSYTIGQRIRIPIPQVEPYKGQWFVSKKLKDSNEIVIVNGKDHPDLFYKTLRIRDFEFLTSAPLFSNNDAHANDRGDMEKEFGKRLDEPTLQNVNIKYRSLHKEVIKVDHISSIEVRSSATGEPTQCLEITLKDPQRAITPGQYCTIYDGDKILGCGTITDRLPN